MSTTNTQATPQPSSGFTHTWTARILSTSPLIAPARQFIYPQHVPGEEDALNRGAILLEVRPASGGLFLATCALGFRDPNLPSGVWACPAPDDLLAVAGGYAYLVNTLKPETCIHLPLRPVTQIISSEAEGLLFLAGFHEVIAIDANGQRWKSARLSWEGVTISGVRDGKLHGIGWNMPADRDVPFTIDLATGAHEGGGFS
jgi:hypothetical protein